MIDAAYASLALVPGIGRARLEMLIATFGSVHRVLEVPLAELAHVPGISRGVARALAAATAEDAIPVLRRARELGAEVLALHEDTFPVLLRTMPDAPCLLFVQGKVEVLGLSAVAIVGSRTHTYYGAEVTRHFAGGLARAGLAVVSGMARGLDAVAHTAALDVGGATIGVLGNGLGVVYPTSNSRLYDRVATEGCLVTESPPDERPQKGSFPRRNRLISGLSRVTLVTEARSRSGALITADCALSQGREVLSVPGPITSPTSAGCNQLIQMGAKAALGLKDVLEEYGLNLMQVGGADRLINLNSDERLVLDALGMGLVHVDDIARSIGRAAAEVLAILTSLEIRELVIQEPGTVFRLKHQMAVGA